MKTFTDTTMFKLTEIKSEVDRHINTARQATECLRQHAIDLQAGIGTDVYYARSLLEDHVIQTCDVIREALSNITT